MANLPGSIKNLNTLLGEQLAEGGGGSSIVHPVQITIVNNTNDQLTLLPTITNDDPMSGYVGGFYISDNGVTIANQESNWIPDIQAGATSVLSPAYCLDDGVIYITDIMGEHYTYTLSGNATKTEMQGMDVIVVTGDCTITVA